MNIKRGFTLEEHCEIFGDTFCPPTVVMRGVISIVCSSYLVGRPWMGGGGWRVEESEEDLEGNGEGWSGTAE